MPLRRPAATGGGAKSGLPRRLALRGAGRAARGETKE